MGLIRNLGTGRRPGDSKEVESSVLNKTLAPQLESSVWSELPLGWILTEESPSNTGAQGSCKSQQL